MVHLGQTRREKKKKRKKRKKKHMLGEEEEKKDYTFRCLYMLTNNPTFKYVTHILDAGWPTKKAAPNSLPVSVSVSLSRVHTRI